MSHLFADVRPEERRGVAGAFFVLFGILAAHTLLETARDALFLARLPASQLPWVYLAMAAVAVALSQASWRGPRRLSAERRLSLLLLACGAVTLSFRLVGSTQDPWMLRALYVWSGVVGTLTGLQFWLLLGERYTITQAKRVYRFIGLGSLLGAVAGAAAARAISLNFSAPDLILASAAVLGLTALAPACLLRGPEVVAHTAAPAETSLRDALRLLHGHPYLSRLAALVLIVAVTVTLADYVFKSAVARSVPAGDLGAYFATVYMVLNVVALVVQLALTGWLLRVLGLHGSLWLFPALLLVGAAGVAFGGGLVAALLLKGADGSLRHSLHRTGTELLFIPIPDSLRTKAKPLIDVVGQRGGQALASVLILGEVSLGRGDTVLAAAAAVLCLLWIAWIVDLRPHYVELFRSALREGTMRDRADLPALDLASLEMLFAALNSGDDGEVGGALDLLVAQGRARLIPALILYHPSRTVVLRAFEILEKSERTDFLPVADRLLASPDEEVRAAALRARTTAAPDEALLRAHANDPSPLVQATALVGLVSAGRVSDEERTTLDALLSRGSPEARVALARAIQRQPVPAFEDTLLKLATSPQPEVLAAVGQAMGAVRSQRFLAELLPMLALREARSASREALRAYGADGLRFLERNLADHELPHEVRRHLPRTISQFSAADAARVLLAHLLPEPDGMVRFKIIRGLGRLAADHPELALDDGVLRRATEGTVEVAFRLIHWRVTLEHGAAQDPRRRRRGHHLLAALMRDKEVHAVERIFRLLGLQLRHEDFRGIHRGLRNTNPKVRASSRELLANLLSAPLREAVVALVDDAPDEQRLLRSRPYFRPEPLAYEALLAALLDQPSESLRCLAAYHVGELGLTSLRERLETLDREETGFFVTRVIQRALRLLSGPEGSLAHAR